MYVVLTYTLDVCAVFDVICIVTADDSKYGVMILVFACSVAGMSVTMDITDVY
jgi:NADH:ubiquinone oxidoreductase subunit 6 (subunit J)